MPGAAWPGGGGRERGEALCQQANTCPSRPARQALRYMQHCPAGPGISAAPNDPKQGGSAHLWPCRLARLRAVGAGGSRRAACPLAELHLPQVPAVPQVEHRQAGGAQTQVLRPCPGGGGGGPTRLTGKGGTQTDGRQTGRAATGCETHHTEAHALRATRQPLPGAAGCRGAAARLDSHPRGRPHHQAAAGGGPELSQRGAGQQDLSQHAAARHAARRTRCKAWQQRAQSRNEAAQRWAQAWVKRACPPLEQCCAERMAQPEGRAARGSLAAGGAPT